MAHVGVTSNDTNTSNTHVSTSDVPQHEGEHEGFGTTAIHAAQEPNPIHGAVMPSLELATTYAQKSPGVHRGFEYSRTGNPTRQVLEKLIAAVEKAKHGLCFASGSAATASITSILKTGDHIVCIDDVYGGTNRYTAYPFLHHETSLSIFVSGYGVHVTTFLMVIFTRKWPK